MSQSTNPKWSMQGLVEAPVERVWEALLAINPYLSPADKQALIHADAPQRFTTTAGYARVRLEVDPQRRSIAEQGEWWYRGVQSVEPHEGGSLLVYRVYNIAPDASRWLVRLVIHRFDASMRDRLQQELYSIGSHLGCAAALITETKGR